MKINKLDFNYMLIVYKFFNLRSFLSKEAEKDREWQNDAKVKESKRFDKAILLVKCVYIKSSQI